MAQKSDENAKNGEKNIKKGKKTHKKVTAAYLERAALHYLRRFSSSTKNLHDVLVRKVRRRNENFAPPSQEQLGWVDEVVHKCISYGYVNDQSYAEQRAQLLLRRGKPVRAIRQDLQHRGIEQTTLKVVLEQLSAEKTVDTDRLAAANYIRRRRFGPFRRELPGAEAVQAKLDKEIAAMARAGFGYALSMELLQLDQQALMDLLA